MCFLKFSLPVDIVLNLFLLMYIDRKKNKLQNSHLNFLKIGIISTNISYNSIKATVKMLTYSKAKNSTG